MKSDNDLISASLICITKRHSKQICAFFMPRKKDRKAYQGEYPGKFNQWIRRLRLGPPIRMGAAQILSSERGKSCYRSSLLLFCLLFFLLPSVFPGFQKRKDEKWNSLMSPLSPALFSTADVENGIWEMGFIISWGLFIPLILISFEVRFFYPLEEKNSENFLDLYSRLRPRGCEKMIYVFSQPLLHT